MRRLIILIALVALAVPGCKKKDAPSKGKATRPAKAAKDRPGEPGKGAPSKDNPGAPPGVRAVPPDNEFAKGKAKAASLELKTTMEIPDPGGKPTTDDEVLQAMERSSINQNMLINGERGKLIFNTAGWYVPEGTEVRYLPAKKQYMLVHMGDRNYWTMNGSELGNFLEGGPAVERTDYLVEFLPTDSDVLNVLDFKAEHTEGELSFDWKVKLKSGLRTGRVRISLSILHTRDKRLPAAWKNTFIDFLTLPFQGQAGAAAMAKIKAKIGFPLRWKMQVVNESQTKKKEDVPITLNTQVILLKIKDVDRRELAYPPEGCNPAHEPFKFKEGGQSVSEKVLAKLPARKGTAPKELEPVQEDEPGEKKEPEEKKQHDKSKQGEE